MVAEASAHGEHGTSEHRCIHDELQELGRIRAAAAPHRAEAIETTRKRAADEDVNVPSEHTPIRVLLDFTFLDAGADPHGLCVKVGQWARIGNPPADSISTHEPICAEKCDTIDSMIGASATCDCWFQCTDADIFYRQKREVLVDRLFPAAVKLLESSYSVLRTPLHLAFNPVPTDSVRGRPCSEYTTCHECSDPAITGNPCSWCKGPGNSGNVCTPSSQCAAPSVVTASGSACENCGCSGEYVPMTKDLLAKYSNYTDHDMVLFVTAHSTRLFSGQTLAYACSCRSNILGRPTFGHINWGSNTINFGTTDRIDLQLGVAVHEITHALVFAQQNFRNFLDTSKSSMYLGKTLGPDFNYPKKTAPSTDQKVVRAKGLQDIDVNKTVTYMTTPKVLEKARAHFNCPTLPGVELEDAGSSGTAGSHWEKRLFNNEYMTGSSAFDPVYSDITMALFEDSGWYTVNYSAADQFYFGRGEGCDFVRPRCDKWLGSYQCTPSEAGHWGCTFDYRARGVCSITKYTRPLLPWNQYFLNNATMGGSELPDFCPFYTYTGNLQSYCAEPSYQADNLAIRGEHFLPSSRCLDSTLLSVTKKGLKGSGACYDVRCVNSKLFVRVANRFYDCSQPGTEIKVNGYNGYVKCPSALLGAELCAQAPKATKLPTVTAVKPTEGRRPRPGDRFDVTGEGLEEIVAVIIGDVRCTKLIGKPTATSVACEFETPKAMAPTPAPTPAPTQDFIGALTDIFVDNKKDVMLDVVVETADGLAGVLQGGFEVNGSAGVYLSAIVVAMVIAVVSCL